MLTFDRKAFIVSICLVAGIVILVFISLNSLILKVVLSLPALLILIPTWYLYRCVQQEKNNLKKSNNNVKKLEKLILGYEDKLEFCQSKATLLKNMIEGIDPIVFSYEGNERNEWYISARFNEIFGIEMEEEQNDIFLLEKIVHPEDQHYFWKMKNKWFTQESITFECRVLNSKGEIVWIEIRTKATIHSNEKITTIYGVIIDITSRKKKEEHLEQMAFYDTLTNLPNRAMLKSHLTKVISRAKRKEHTLSIMFLDLDGFKHVNDTLGHDVGDSLLKEVAKRIDESIRDEDLLSRLGGDEFIIVFEETSKDELTSIAERILTNVSIPYNIQESSVTITPSIGISNYPEDGTDIETLVINADKAMYVAKNNGKNNFHYFTHELKNYELKTSVIERIRNLLFHKGTTDS